LRLLLKQAGNLLEELFSPLVLAGPEVLEELRPLARLCVTQHIARHYLGFFNACARKATQPGRREAKMALYAVRLATTGMLVLNEAEIESHLPTLGEHFGLDWVPEWISWKTTEHASLEPERVPEVTRRLDELRAALKKAARDSRLPTEPQGVAQLSRWLVAVRRAHLNGSR
jgi:predicted nucleotidyltransferase